jgi:LysR family hydrogen peroxide-inducible transcriptional activator
LTVPANSEIYDRADIQNNNLARLNLLALSAIDDLHDVVGKCAAELGGRVSHDFEPSNLDTLREMVAAGLGMSIFPGLYVYGVASKDLRLKNFLLNDLCPSRSIAVYWWKNTPAERHLIRLATITREVISFEFDEAAAEAA